MQTVCIVSSFLVLILATGSMEWYCIRYEKHLECDEPEYTGEFGTESTTMFEKGACKHNDSVISFQQSLRAYNRNN